MKLPREVRETWEAEEQEEELCLMMYEHGDIPNATWDIPFGHRVDGSTLENTDEWLEEGRWLDELTGEHEEG